MGSFAVFESYEGTVTTEKTVRFDNPSARVVIKNKSSDKTLSFKFDAARAVATLDPGEIFDFDFEAKQIIIDGESVEYRIWVLM